MRARLRGLLNTLGVGRPRAPRPAPRVPEGMVVYAIGDVHGERTALERLLDRIRDDAARRQAAPVAVFVGDYIDRGADSRGVLDLLCADPLPGFTVRRLLGNHEQAMLDFLDTPDGGTEWLEFGGVATLDSYGVRGLVGAPDGARLNALRQELAARLPDAHQRLLRSLEPYAVYGDYAFVHAGIRPGGPLAQQRLEDLLWIREPFLGWPAHHEKVIVHGHTVVPAPQILPNRIAIDTGVYASGVLTAAVLEADGVRVLQARR
ncbi:MAG TPA: metallophosphoesterase family protein [Azospirillum sp.]